MTKRRTAKHALLMSGLSLILCVSMLIGSTYAWFTDSVTSAGNIIKSGTLDVTMEWKDATATGKVTEYKDASKGPIFDYELWEPGYVEAKNVKIANDGTLALKYNLSIIPTGEVSDLADVIDVYYADGEHTLANRKLSEKLTYVGTIRSILDGMPSNMMGTLDAGKDAVVTIALKMREQAGNEYQNKSIGSEFAVKLIATQLTSESDSFDDQYDKAAGWTGDAVQPEFDAENGRFLIGSAEELAWFAQYVNGEAAVTYAARGTAPGGHNAVLTADINLNNLPWTPIGRTLTAEESAAGAQAFDYQFHGSSGNHAVFDGNGHTVYGLNVNEKQNAGLFGAAVYAKIINVNVNGAKVVSNHFAGTVLGQGYARVENCNVSNATVICTPELLGTGWDNGDKVGGVVGKISESNDTSGVYGVVGCSATNVSVTAYRDCGGILGFAGNYAKVLNNKVTNVTLNQDATHDYKAFGTTSKYNFNAIVGDSTRSPGVEVTGNAGEADINYMMTAANQSALDAALTDGVATVILSAGSYSFPAGKLTEGQTIICEEGTVFEGKSSLDIKGATVEGATFKNEDGQAVSGTVNGTFKNCVFEGEEALRWCYSNAGETVVFENCVIKTDFRGFHFDGMEGTVIFKNCEINGFNAYGGDGKIIFEGCTFGNDRSNYNGLNIYSDTELINCTFNFKSGKTNFIDMEGVGKTLTITNCKATLDGAAVEVSDFVGGSKLAQNTVIYN